MLQRLPERVDPFRLAESGYRFHGRLPIAEFQRFGAALAGTGGDVEVGLEFGADEAGTRFLYGRLTAQVAVTCQRCLEPMAHALRAEFRLALVRGEGEADALSERYEPLAVEDTGLGLRDVLEDELLLALPLVARHERDACPASQVLDREAQDADAAAKRDNPFAVLAGLKQKRDE